MTEENLLKAIDDPLHNIFYFQQEVAFKKPHYYITIPTKNSSEVIMLAMLTSQLDKKKKFYKDNENGLACLLKITKGEIPFLTAEASIIDCNRLFMTTKEELLKIKKIQILNKNINISKDILRAIAKRINRSNAHKPSIKKLIDLSILQ